MTTFLLYRVTECQTQDERLQFSKMLYVQEKPIHIALINVQQTATDIVSQTYMYDMDVLCYCLFNLSFFLYLILFDFFKFQILFISLQNKSSLLRCVFSICDFKNATKEIVYVFHMLYMYVFSKLKSSKSVIQWYFSYVFVYVRFIQCLSKEVTGHVRHI